MLLLLIIVSAYIVGSFPTAYYVIKRIARLDIRSAGSGNVGGYNTYEVSGSRRAGIFVAVLDTCKGALVVVAVSQIAPGDSWAIFSAFLAVVIGHCFPVWLRFRGGRGLATAAGAMLVIAWPFVIIWLFWWLIAYYASGNIHIGNVAAVVLMLGHAFIMPDHWMLLMVRPDVGLSRFLLLMILLSSILLFRHFQPMKSLIQGDTNL